MERPKELAGKQVLTAEEAAKFEVEHNRRENRDLIDPEKGGSVYPPGAVIPYNEFWYDRGSKVIGSRRTSLIVDPADGRIPPLTPEAQRRQDALAVVQREDQLPGGHPHADSWEDRSVTDRCILGFNSGPPMVPGAYNNNVQIFQSPEYVVIHNEMNHNARIVTVDGRPHGSIRQWNGESRGRWEGDTLVVDVVHFNDQTWFDRAGNFHSDALHVVERYTPTDVVHINYEVTIEDPKVFTRPWKMTMVLYRRKEPNVQLLEYECFVYKADDEEARSQGK
jgi:hypothetical protein